MTHNDFDFYEDLIRPLMKFLVQANILQPLEESEEEEDSEFEQGEDGQELCRSEIVKLKGQTNVLDLTNGIENFSATQRLQFEANQVDKVGEAEEEAGGISLLGKAGKQGVL